MRKRNKLYQLYCLGGGGTTDVETEESFSDAAQNISNPVENDDDNDDEPKSKKRSFNSNFEH